MVKRLNVYLKKDIQELVNQGKRNGIKPSKALAEGYKLLLGKKATYSVLEERRNILLKELSDVECQMDKIKDEIIIDPSNQEQVLKDLTRAYIENGVILDQTLDIRRIELNLTLGEMKKLVQEKVIDPVDAGKITIFDVDGIDKSNSSQNDLDLAKTFFKNQYEREGKFNELDVKNVASRLNLESDKLLSILEGELHR